MSTIGKASNPKLLSKEALENLRKSKPELWVSHPNNLVKIIGELLDHIDALDVPNVKPTKEDDDKPKTEILADRFFVLDENDESFFGRADSLENAVKILEDRVDDSHAGIIAVEARAIYKTKTTFV